MCQNLSNLTYFIDKLAATFYIRTKLTRGKLMQKTQLNIDFEQSLGTNKMPDVLTINKEFDADLAKTLAQAESFNKHLYRPNNYLHKWWARRCGTTFRLILKSLVDNPEKRDFYTAGGLEGKVILDPMMGGGTTLHEAIRLGANVIGADIDPIPAMQARATLSELPLSDLDLAFDKFFSSISDQLRDYFSTSCPHCNNNAPTQYVLNGLRKTCDCGEAVFVDSYILRHETDGSTVNICPDCLQVYTGDHVCNSKGKFRLFEKTISKCENCQKKFSEMLDLPFFERYVPVTIVAKCETHGSFIKSVEKKDIKLVEGANKLRKELNFGDIDLFKVVPGPKSSELIRKGVKSYIDLFSSRQLIYITAAKNALSKLNPLERLNLGLLLSTSLEFNSMLCGYKGAEKRRPGAIRHVFSHHAYSFPSTALENNPVFPFKSSGNLLNLYNDRIQKARKWALNPVERVIKDGVIKTTIISGETDQGYEIKGQEALKTGTRKFLLIHGSSTALDIKNNSVDHVITDPPYYDSVQYSDLAAFFRVWLRLFLPEYDGWDYDVLDSAVDSPNQGEKKYEDILGDIYSECHRVLKKDHGKLIFTYHHWNPKGWAALTIALKRAGFVLADQYIVHSENPVSVHIRTLKALKHDSILIFTPRGSSIKDNKWPEPAIINTADSYEFCQRCGEVLGWLLQADLSESEISAKWEKTVKL